MATTETNYATWVMDDSKGLAYIIDKPTGKRLYKLAECDLCGMVPLSFSGGKDGWDCCKQHLNKERNDNDQNLLCVVPA